MTATRADDSRNDRRRWLLVAALIALGLGLASAALWQRYSPEARAKAQTRALADAVLAEFGKDLPRPFGEGLVLESVAFEGTRLVLTIRSSSRLATVEAARNSASLQQVRDAEQEQMLAYCSNPDMLHLLSQGIGITRRFVDARGDRFFDVSLTGSDCARSR